MTNQTASVKVKLSKEERIKRRAKWGWYLYDFGNSAYAAVILLAVYSAYFQGKVVGGSEGTRMWGIALGIAMLVVAVVSPFLGAIADYAAYKKRFLFFFSALSWVFTALLFFVNKGNIVSGTIFFIMAEIGYRGAQVFYNALLPDVATEEEMGRVSGNGWAIGSIGGIVCLLFILPAIMFIKDPALVETDFIIRASFPFTAIFFAAATLPLFFWVKEKHIRRALPAGDNFLTLAFKRLKHTFQAVKHFKEFLKFILAFLIYNDGVLMALNFASILGGVLFGMKTQQLIIFMIIVQFTSALGAYVFGLLAEKRGFKSMLIISLVLMIGSVVWMIFNGSATLYYVIGGLAGFALTGVQSLSRTMTGLFAPQAKTTEFFSFFAIAGKSSSFIGPTIFGIIAHAAAVWFEKGGQAADEALKLGHRAGTVAIAIMLLIGLFLLLLVNEKKARAAAIEHGESEHAG